MESVGSVLPGVNKKSVNVMRLKGKPSEILAEVVTSIRNSTRSFKKELTNQKVEEGYTGDEWEGPLDLQVKC